MTTKFVTGDVVFQAVGEWSNGRPIEFDSPIRETESEATADVIDRIGELTTNEQERVKYCGVMAFRVIETEDESPDGIGYMMSIGSLIPYHDDVV